MAPKKKYSVSAATPKRTAAAKTKHECKSRDTKNKLKEKPAEDAPKGCRRQLTRRLTEEQTDRFVERKLSHISMSIIDTVENSEGLKLKDYIAREVRGQKKRNVRSSSEFMVKLDE